MDLGISAGADGWWKYTQYCVLHYYYCYVPENYTLDYE